MFFLLIKILFIIIPVLLVVALFTLLERNLMGSMQHRAGPNVSGIFGLLQPIYDLCKLGLKEPLKLTNVQTNIYLIAPVISLICSQVLWAVVPINVDFALTNSNLQGLFLMALSSISVYGIVLAGWSSNSKYAFLGSCRSIAQMISYELPMGVLLLVLILINKNMYYLHTINLIDIQYNQSQSWFLLAFLPISIIWFICILAETNRAPFDLPEAEAELVAGYNVEYGSLAFALFFVAEYGNMLIMCFLTSIYLLGGGTSIIDLFYFFPNYFNLAIKVVILCIFYVWVRATLPRYRYDQLMNIGWKSILLFSITWFVIQLIIALIFVSYH
jgi:NADH-quinone oxidoreductase subunit H